MGNFPKTPSDREYYRISYATYVICTICSLLCINLTPFLQCNCQYFSVAVQVASRTDLLVQPSVVQQVYVLVAGQILSSHSMPGCMLLYMHIYLRS